MTDRPTPETDAEWRRLQSGHLDTIGLASGMCRFAKGLERKRDEAEKQRDRLAEALERIAEGSSCCACRGSAELATIALEALAAVKGGTHDP
jgi:hypothetical protein